MQEVELDLSELFITLTGSYDHGTAFCLQRPHAVLEGGQ